MPSLEKQDIEKLLWSYIRHSKVKQYMSKEITEAVRQFVDVFISNLKSAFLKIQRSLDDEGNQLEPVDISLLRLSIPEMTSYDALYVNRLEERQGKTTIYFRTISKEDGMPRLWVELDIHPLFSAVFVFCLQFNPSWVIETDAPLEGLGGLMGALPKLQEFYIFDLDVHFYTGVRLHFDMSLFHTNFNLVHHPSTYGGWAEILCQHIARSFLLFYNINAPQENDLSRWVGDVAEVLWQEILFSAMDFRYRVNTEGRRASIVYDKPAESYSSSVDYVRIRLLGETTPLYKPRSVEKEFSIPLGSFIVYLRDNDKMVKWELGHVSINLHLSLVYDYYEILQLQKASLYLSADVTTRDGKTLVISGDRRWWGTVVELHDGKTLPPPRQVVQDLVRNIGDGKGFDEMFSSISYQIAVELVCSQGGD